MQAHDVSLGGVMKNILFIFLILIVMSLPEIAGAGVRYQFEDSEHLTVFDMSSAVRAYYLNDQRVQWSGMESVFGAAAILAPQITREYPWGVTAVKSEFMIRQPFGKRNLALSDSNIAKYAPYFDVNTLETSQMYIHISKNNTLSIDIGKIKTPFGRTEYPVLWDWRFDAPFIRSSELILYRETGVMISYTPEFFSLEVAAVNGEGEKDTNSGKAVIARVGTGKNKNWEFGLSGKWHDGIGSEYDKTYNNYLGVDFKVRLHPKFVLSGEITYDQHGYHQKKGEENGTTSLYYREIYVNGNSIYGIGGYLDLGYKDDHWNVHFNYGEYYPEKVGNPYHDDPIKRLLINVVYRILPEVQVFATGLLENERSIEDWRKQQSPYGYWFGLQYTF
jgi:hypothetical protein